MEDVAPTRAPFALPHSGETMTTKLIARLRTITGRRHVLTGSRRTRHYSKGFRYGEGPVLAVVRPGTLVEQWRVLQTCIDHDAAIIMQAANTGLTGGSTPDGNGYDRGIVIINTMRISRLDLIEGGKQVVALPGVKLDQLERTLRPVGREPHSVIGSSCIGASVTGGICNNSGGSLIRRGPAYTQYALFAQVNQDGRLSLVNHLGIDLGEDPETILTRLDKRQYSEKDIRSSGNQWASDREYHSHVRDVEAGTPARYNADPRRLFEVSGSAGKLAVFAVRLDTFPADEAAKVFYIGTNSKAELSEIRRHILSSFKNLPVAGEYIHRDAYAMTRRYGKDIFLFIRAFGTDRIPLAFAVKSWLDGVTEGLRLGTGFADRIAQVFSDLLPDHLPHRMKDFEKRFEHHLMLKVADTGIEETREYLSFFFAEHSGDSFECSDREGEDAFLHRFAFGSASSRLVALNRKKMGSILALDVAFARNDDDWLPDLPPDAAGQIEHYLVCGHFFCHVFHQDYILKKGADPEKAKASLLEALEARGAKYPAEHNVGHQYTAGPSLAKHYKSLDPSNTMNPGIGKTSKKRNWA